MFSRHLCLLSANYNFLSVQRCVCKKNKKPHTSVFCVHEGVGGPSPSVRKTPGYIPAAITDGTWHGVRGRGAWGGEWGGGGGEVGGEEGWDGCDGGGGCGGVCGGCGGSGGSGAGGGGGGAGGGGGPGGGGGGRWWWWCLCCWWLWW